MVFCPKNTSRIDAVDFRHGDIRNNNVGAEPLSHFDKRAAIKEREDKRNMDKALRRR